jgi:hypothetical protein
MLGRPALDIAHLVGQPKAAGFTIRLPGPRLTAFRTLPARAGSAMDLFTQLFGNLLVFVYHCFDRIVIYGYLSGLSRPERVVNLFHQIVGVPVVSKEVLSQRTADYQNCVEAYARNHRIPIEWAEKGVRKEHYVLPWQRRRHGVQSFQANRASNCMPFSGQMFGSHEMLCWPAGQVTTCRSQSTSSLSD